MSTHDDWADAAAYMLAGQIDKEILDTITTTTSVYTDGTKLLRDFAQLSDDYLYKKMVARRGWKTRYEIRNV